MNNFITNEPGTDLKTALNKYCSISLEMKFLVGFFYFSGIRELYEGIKENPLGILKILVGMNIDLLNYQFVEVAHDGNTRSQTQIAESYLAEVKKSLSEEDFDTQEFYEQVRYFVQLMVGNRLLIRKSRDPNHAKLYFFNAPSEMFRKKLFITGSSNLTRPGITTQSEFNVAISDYGTDEAEAYFDNLWESSVEITEHDQVKKELLRIIEKDTLVREITPYEAYVLSLKSYLDSYKLQELSDSIKNLLIENQYTPYKYQLDAVSQALSIIENNNGVIIADVVGLGKTIIACAIGRELRKRGLVICPPGLIGDKNKTSGWLMYLEQFKMADWEVRSAGDLEKTAEFIRNVNDIEIVIIDEAHRFRNQNTQSYEHLRNICRGKIVILLTATPFNNRPSDILSMLKLFILPKKSSITLQNNLDIKFSIYKTTFDRLSFIRRYWDSKDNAKKQKAKNYYISLFGTGEIDLNNVKARTQYLAGEIRDVIEPVTIRRNRLDLQKNVDYRNEVKHLSKVADPKEWFYELTKAQSDFYDKILRKYFASREDGGEYTGAIYQPFAYEEDEVDELDEKKNFEFFQQQNLNEFMRRLLVKRFESSFGSFQKSIKRFKDITEHALQFITKTKQYILDRKLLEEIYELDEEEIEKKLADYSEKLLVGNFPKSNKIYKVDKFAKKEDFLKDIRSDLQMYDQILEELDQFDIQHNDPKCDCMIQNIQRVIRERPLSGEPKRKVVIFTEYSDTVSHLEERLLKSFGDRLLVIKSLSTNVINVINRNFDASFQNPKDEFDILLATDKLSEGFNLNRAGMVINYDIPWNPVRVIQRLGRINRISKKVFDTLYIVNFFPTEKGAGLVQSKEIAAQKMFLIHNILGEDAKIFDVDEEPSASALYAKFNQSPDDAEEESFYTKMLNRFRVVEKNHPDLIATLNDFPPRVKVAKQGATDELLVLFRKGRLYIQGIDYNNENSDIPVQYSFEQALPKIECSREEQRKELSDRFWEKYEITRTIKEGNQRSSNSKSLEKQARNIIKTILHGNYTDLLPMKPFLQVLLKDIEDYGTLPDFTLRRIVNLDPTKKAKKKEVLQELTAIEKELGADYLDKEIARLKKKKQEIIIAIENRKI